MSYLLLGNVEIPEFLSWALRVIKTHTDTTKLNPAARDDALRC